MVVERQIHNIVAEIHLVQEGQLVDLIRNGVLQPESGQLDRDDALVAVLANEVSARDALAGAHRDVVRPRVLALDPVRPSRLREEPVENFLLGQPLILVVGVVRLAVAVGVAGRGPRVRAAWTGLASSTLARPRAAVVVERLLGTEDGVAARGPVVVYVDDLADLAVPPAAEVTEGRGDARKTVFDRVEFHVRETLEACGDGARELVVFEAAVWQLAGEKCWNVVLAHELRMAGQHNQNHTRPGHFERDEKKKHKFKALTGSA